MTFAARFRSDGADGLGAFAGVLRVAVAVVLLLLALPGCAPIAPRAAEPADVEVPAAWSVADAAAAPGTSLH